MFCAGFDISTKAIDCVLIDLDEEAWPEWHHFPFAGPDAWERARTIADIVPSRSWWENEGLYAAGIEVPFGFSSAKVSMVIGALLNRLPRDILIERWPHNRWRAALKLKGGGTSEELKAAARVRSLQELGCDDTGSAVRYYGGAPDEWTVDAHEAHLIALATRQAISREAAA